MVGVMDLDGTLIDRRIVFEGPLELVDGLDAELSRLARGAGLLRLGLADGLEALARLDGHHEMGFATVEAYALERCERSARWVQESRWLSRRLSELPAVRAALGRGDVSFSMAQVIAKVASPEKEELWLSEARQRTVREMRLLVKERSEAAGQISAVAEEERATLTLTMDREDAWLFECARMLVERVAGGPLEQTVEALLGEGVTSLLPRVDGKASTLLDQVMNEREAQRAWEMELGRYREEAERRCETAAKRAKGDGSRGDAEPMPTEWQRDVEGIDAELRRIAAELGRRELVLGEQAERFWKADGWRRLGYATESQYARERLGMSLSSVKAKRALARRVKLLPAVGDAVRDAKLGYEAARLLAGVATQETAEAWVDRARERTVRHLREEVDAAQMLARLGIDEAACPPDVTVMEELARIERRVVTGEVFDSAVSGQKSAENEEDAAARPARGRAQSRGRVTVRVRVTVGTLGYFRWLERLFLRSGPRQLSFIRFLCIGLIDSWKHAFRSDEAYSRVYARDRFRCTNPVCGRTDVTPHHLRFRSLGGDESDENLASLCVWCHLEGVHGGRIVVTPPASAMRWRIGRRGQTVVDGRRRTVS